VTAGLPVEHCSKGRIDCLFDRMIQTGELLSELQEMIEEALLDTEAATIPQYL
jgi:hypothetical protein